MAKQWVQVRNKIPSAPSVTMEIAKTQMPLYFVMAAIWLCIRSAMVFPSYLRANGFAANAS
jgi:hypothetical protein